MSNIANMKRPMGVTLFIPILKNLIGFKSGELLEIAGYLRLSKQNFCEIVLTYKYNLIFYFTFFIFLLFILLEIYFIIIFSVGLFILLLFFLLDYLFY
jgi:hypothetical protein